MSYMTSAGTLDQMAVLGRLSARIADLLAGHLYFPCVVIAHPEVAILRTAQDYLMGHQKWQAVSVGGFLSEALLDIPFKRRQRVARQSFLEEIRQQVPGPALCIDIDLLFEPSLALDPLALIRECSRQTPVVVMWPGEYKDKVLSYAVPEHAHYRIWRQTDLCDQCIIPL